MAARSGVHRPAMIGVAGRLRDDVDDLYRRTGVDPVQPRRSAKLEVVNFTFDGSVTTGLSVIHPVVRGGKIYQVKWRLVTAGASGLTFEVHKNGAIAGVSVTLPGSTPDGTATIGASIYATVDDDLQADVTAAGSGNAQLTLQLWMKS